MAAYWDPDVETMGREELRAVQRERLRWQVARCYAASELYRAKFRQVGAEPGDIVDLDDLARLPVVTKEELRQDQGAHPPFGSFVIAEPATWRELHPSTGTTGVPVSTSGSMKAVGT